MPAPQKQAPLRRYGFGPISTATNPLNDLGVYGPQNRPTVPVKRGPGRPRNRPVVDPIVKLRQQQLAKEKARAARDATRRLKLETSIELKLNVNESTPALPWGGTASAVISQQNAEQEPVVKLKLKILKKHITEYIVYMQAQTRIRQWAKAKEAADIIQEPARLGRAPVLPADAIEDIKSAIQEQVDKRVPVTTSNMRSMVIRIIKRTGHEHVLEENGGSFKCSWSWVGNFLRQMGFSWRSATTAAQKLPSNWVKQLKLRAPRLAHYVS
ncbi:TPA: hypothetical protein ACH3X2_010539 [Trebouxia sp. C0005]